MFLQLGLDLGDHGVQGIRSQLVDLGQHRLERHGGSVQQGHDLVVHRLDAMARIDQAKGPAQGRASCQIVFQQRLPFGDHRDRRLGKAVAGQVHQIAALAQGEIVDLLGPARRVGGPGDALAAGQGVDQAGLAHVAAARETDLGPVGRGQAVHRDHAFQEIDRTGEQQARGLGRVLIGFGGDGKGDLHAATASPRAILPPVTTSAKMPKSVCP